MFKLYNDHIPEEVRQKLIHDKEYHDLPRRKYKFFYFKNFNNPSTSLESALHYIWKDVIDVSLYPDGGIEYWVNKEQVENGKSKHPNTIWHPDVYEPNTTTRDKWKSGIYGCVYYPYVDCIGGFFEICDNKTKLSYDEYFQYICGLNESTQVERLKAVTNRAIFFEPHRIHRATRIHHGIRESLACTVWEKKPVDF